MTPAGTPDLPEALAPPRVVVDHLTVRARNSPREIVQDISLLVAAGEVLGIVGESGSGKTTIGLATIWHTRRGLEISGGSVVFDGTTLGDLSAEQLRQRRGTSLAYVPQDPGTALNPARKIGSQLLEALTAHGRSNAEAHERVAETLGEVGLSGIPELLNSYPHQLSGGQQQRVTIALAFACRPGLIVLDEPTTGLDVTTQRTVLATIRKLSSDYGVAAVYISHDVLVVGELADRVAVMYAGRLVEMGETAQVLGRPEHPYTRALLRAVPAPERAVQLHGIEGMPPRAGQRPGGCAFAPRCPSSFEQCQTEPPLMRAGPGNHVSRCWLTKETVASPTTLAVVASSEEDNPKEDAVVRSDAILSISGVSASYGSREVLHDLALDVASNACVAIVGESGSGKTTLARCIAGLHGNWTGDITLEDTALTPGIRRRSKGLLRDVQYIFQNPYASLNPRRAIGNILAQPLEHFTAVRGRQRDAKVVEAMQSVGMATELLDRYPDQLSGGERQRVAIARALIVRPRILVCDEITSALDVSVQASVVEMLRGLQIEHNLTLIFITHNVALVRSIAQAVAVLQSGRIVESGPTDMILDDPQTDYTRKLMDDVPKFNIRERGDQAA